MNSFVIFVVCALAASVNCEAPGGYNYNRPQSTGSGFASSGSSLGGAGGGYQQEAVGGSTNEGAQVDAQLLEQIRQILLREESQGSGGNGGNSGAARPSSSYGAPPSSSYGVPQQQSARVVGIVLENTIPAIQVAQYKAQEQSSAGGVAGGFAGYPSGPSNFGSAPSVNAPRSSYGAPF
jgi:hypothetical protein